MFSSNKRINYFKRVIFYYFRKGQRPHHSVALATDLGFQKCRTPPVTNTRTGSGTMMNERKLLKASEYYAENYRILTTMNADRWAVENRLRLLSTTWPRATVVPRTLRQARSSSAVWTLTRGVLDLVDQLHLPGTNVIIFHETRIEKEKQRAQRFGFEFTFLYSLSIAKERHGQTSSSSNFKYTKKRTLFRMPKMIVKFKKSFFHILTLELPKLSLSFNFEKSNKQLFWLEFLLSNTVFTRRIVFRLSEVAL